MNLTDVTDGWEQYENQREAAAAARMRYEDSSDDEDAVEILKKSAERTTMSTARARIIKGRKRKEGVMVAIFVVTIVFVVLFEKNERPSLFHCRQNL